MPKIHEQKREIVERIDSRNLVVELNAVEQPRFALQQADIAQMQVTVASPDLAGDFTCIEQRCISRQIALESVFEVGKLDGVEERARGKTGHIDTQHGRHVGGAGSLMNDLGALVKAGDHVCCPRHQFGIELASNGHAIEQHLLVEPDHFDDRIDKLLALIINKAAIAAAHDPSYADVQARCSGAVQRHLLFTSGKPQFRRREIHIGQLHRSLHLVSAFAGKEDAGDVGLDDLDLIRATRVGRAQKGDDLRLILGNHKMPFCPAGTISSIRNSPSANSRGAPRHEIMINTTSIRLIDQCQGTMKRWR